MQHSLKKRIILLVFAFFILFVAFYFNNMTVIGVSLIAVSVYTCFAVRENRTLFFLMVIIGLININVGIYNCIMHGYGAPIWQKEGLLSTDFNIIASRSMLILNCCLLVIIGGKNWDNVPSESIKPITEDKQCNNILITIGGVIVLYIILIYGLITEFLGRSEGYSSVESPIYEYSSIIMVLVWYFSEKWKDKVKIVMGIYVVIFSFIFLSIGDRSSVVIILSLFYLMYFSEKFSIYKLLVLLLISIFFLNVIGKVRNGYVGNINDIIHNVFLSGIYVDTFTYAYYTSIAITALNSYIADPSVIFISSLKNIFLGITDEYAFLTIYARNSYKALANVGGCVYSAYFYAMGKYFGVLGGSILLSMVINKVFSSSGKYVRIYQYIIAAMTFRWYLYSFTTLYRGGIIFTSIALGICLLINKVTTKRDRIK